MNIKTTHTFVDSAYQNYVWKHRQANNILLYETIMCIIQNEFIYIRDTYLNI